MRGRGVAAGYSLSGGETSALGWGDPRGGPACPWSWLSLTCAWPCSFHPPGPGGGTGANTGDRYATSHG